MPSTQIQKRLASLFSDIEKLAVEPELDLSLRAELEVFRARVTDLKEQRVVQGPATESGASGAPIIYGKEHLGYAYTDDRLERTTRAGLTDLGSVKGLKVPIIDTGEAIGEVFVESPPGRPIGSDEASLAEAIARQASLQIQNLRLLEAAQRARAEALSATRQFTHQNWENFLDAIHQREKIGFVYDQNEVNFLGGAAPSNPDFETAVSVLYEQVGKLILETHSGQSLTEEDKALTQAVARQVAQQVENLRLLADATRARAEAEATLKQAARENWQAFVEAREETTLGFLYDSNQVHPLSAVPPVADIAATQDILVQGQSIGQLAVAGVDHLSTEQQELLATLSERLSLHLETLRLNEELRRRAVELQELDRLKSSFLANMSHELRTPLNAILGFSDVMLEGIDGELTDYMENDLKLIQKNGQHLLHLINDVLDMAKIESGRMNLHPEKFNLQGLFEDVFSITSSLANAKGIELLVAGDSARELEITADVTRIRQVMINLVNNSIKFTEKGQIIIRAAPQGRDHVLIAVKDTGLGIPADHLEKIFQEFAQVDASTTRKAGGTGLGLPISRRLVEMHGGHMWAESEGLPGKGSTFFVELPLEARIVDVAEKKVK